MPEVSLVSHDLSNHKLYYNKSLEKRFKDTHTHTHTYTHTHHIHLVQFSSVQSLSRVWLFTTPWIAARQASCRYPLKKSRPKLVKLIHRHPVGRPSLLQKLRLFLSWPANGFKPQEIYDCAMIHWLYRSQTGSFVSVLRLQFRILASLPSLQRQKGNNKHEESDKNTKHLTLSLNINEDSLRISIFELKIWKKNGRRRHMSKEGFQIEAIGFILMRPQWSSGNLIGNFILIGLIDLCFEKFLKLRINKIKGKGNLLKTLELMKFFF